MLQLHGKDVNGTYECLIKCIVVNLLYMYIAV